VENIQFKKMYKQGEEEDSEDIELSDDSASYKDVE